MDDIMMKKMMSVEAEPAMEEPETDDVELKASLMDEIMALIDEAALNRLPKKPSESPEVEISLEKA